MKLISSLLPETVPPKQIILPAETVQRPSALKAWWSDDGATELPVERGDRSFHFGPIGHYTARNVTVLPDALAFNDDGMLLDHAIQLGAYRKTPKMWRVTENWQQNIDEFHAKGAKPRRYSEPVMLGISQGGKKVWGHWIVQNLPKCLFFLENFPTGKIAIPSAYMKKFPNFGDSLLRAGCPPERLLLLKSLQPYFFEELIVLDYLYGPHIAHPKAIQLLEATSERISKTPEYAQSRIPPAKRIFVPRTRKGIRDIVNGDEIAALAERHGFSVIPLGNYSFTEQVRAWREAEVVVSVCGSDLTNMVFGQGKLRIGSLTPTWFKDIFFVDLASAKGFEWYELFCSISPDDGVGIKRPLYVNPQFAEKLFDAITA